MLPGVAQPTGGRAGAGARSSSSSSARPERGPGRVGRGRGGGGGGGEAGSVRAHLTLRRSGTPTRESGPEAGPSHPPHPRTPAPLRSVPNGCRQSAALRPPGLGSHGTRTGPQPRTAWTRCLSRSRRRHHQSERLRATGGRAAGAPTAARQSPTAAREEGDAADLCPPKARLLSRAQGRRHPRAERGMSRRLPRVFGQAGRGFASSHAAGSRRLGRRGRARRGQKRPPSGSRRLG
ncbi:THO complex subunit 4-like [Orcinus orca]|uniref:THO complex subunit 4-like n=1 Tax=Orcinus orca TaxID=9733 RepID=UPI0021117718|nr:THO complex subunit 4-like [Orcinus orca]